MRIYFFLICICASLFIACDNDPKSNGQASSTPTQPKTEQAPKTTEAPVKNTTDATKAATETQKPTSPIEKNTAQGNAKTAQSSPTNAVPSGKGLTDEEYKMMEKEIMESSGIDKEKAMQKLRNRKAGGSSKGSVSKSKIEKESPFYFGSTCALVTEDFIAKTVGVGPNIVKLKDGSSKSTPHARSCFYRWNHKGAANAGVLVQISGNPLPDEFPDWASYYISAKKNQGDQNPDGSGAYRYKDFPGIGEAGAYSYDLGRYCWKTKQDHVFLVAFNLIGKEEEQKQWAKEIGMEMMQNFYN